MGSHVLEVLRQGLWASVTGGWFYDPHLSLFSNTFHLYLWLFLFITPFVLHITIPRPVALIAWGFYCLFIGVLFVIIKVINYKLHMLFDTTEKIEAPTSSQTNDSWNRAQSISPASIENIELDVIGGSSRASQRSPVSRNSKDPSKAVVTADIERGGATAIERGGTAAASDASGGTSAASGTQAAMPNITSLEDITSMEDITSLEDLQLDDLKSESAITSPDRVEKFRRTVKAMSTQVTPQTSPLVGYKRRALSQERWPTPFLSAGTTPPLQAKRHQPQYHSQRVTRRRSATYRRRSKSVLDSPHGSHMLVGESRAEEQPPLTLEWAGYPHPSPRPRHRNRQMSLEEPLHGSSGRRYSLDLNGSRRGRQRDRYGRATKSSDIPSRREIENSADDIKAIKEKLLNHAHSRKISTVSEPSGPYGESESDSSRDGDLHKSTKPPLPPADSLTGSRSHSLSSAPIKATQASQRLGNVRSNSLPIAEVSPAAESIPQQVSEASRRDSVDGADVVDEAQDVFMDAELNAADKLRRLSADRVSVKRILTDQIVDEELDEVVETKPGNENTNNNTDASEDKDKNKGKDSEDEKCTGDQSSDGSKSAAALNQKKQAAVEGESSKSLSRVDEGLELERPRNPTPTAASSSTADIGDVVDTGAIPKKGPKYDRKRERTRHVSADDAVMLQKHNEGTSDPLPLALHNDESKEQTNASPNSSTSGGSENTALLLSLKASTAAELDQRQSVLKRRPAVRRHTTAELRGSVRRARYYGSHSSWGSRRSSRSHRHSDSEPPDPTLNPTTPTLPGDQSADEWHYFQDADGCWFKYTFASSSDGLPINLGKNFRPWEASEETSGDAEGLSAHHGSGAAEGGYDPFRDYETGMDYHEYERSIQPRGGRAAGIGNITGPLGGTIGSILRSRYSETRSDSDTASSDTSIPIERATPQPPKPKQFYKWKLFKSLPSVKIWLDRLSLLALLDRNVSKKESVASVLLSLIVSVLASVLLFSQYYRDIWILIFCFVVAGCQYSLLKSVQPDAASPTHGYNNVIIYSRAFYFCVISLLIIIVDIAVTEFKGSTFTLYGIDIISSYLLVYARELLKVLMLCLPLIFTFGLLPQVNTFGQYLLEQIEIHVFGGNGTTSLLAAAYTVLHSCVAVGILYGIAFVPIQLLGRDKNNIADVPYHVTFSVFNAILVSLSYHYSRMSSDPTHIWMLLKSKLGKQKEAVNDEETSESGETIEDPLPAQICKSVYQRLRNDLISCIVIIILVFGVHVSTVFSGKLQPKLHEILSYLTIAIGFLLHYVMSQLRKEYPWLCFAHPVLKKPERSQYNVGGPASITWFEKIYIWMRFIEKNFLYPTVFLSGISISTPSILDKFGLYIGPLVLVVCSLKSLRCAYSDTPSQYCVLALTQFAFNFDYHRIPEREMFILNYALMLLFYSKFVDFYLKCKFIFVYIAPWQLAWGSAFHAFAQPLSVPHACMLFVQAALSALLYTPLNPFLGSAIFINSYMRPVKFWEKDYNTKRVDHSNIRLASQVENNLGSDDNNLNSIFYEHLTRSLQNMLCGDLMMGRWGQVQQGDMFIMASDYLNALVHIVEMGNGLVTFQLRGLEFRGTYCQQREVEAITEGVDDDIGFCCCNPGHLPHFLSVNAAFGERWLAWEVTVTMYILDGYSITDNNAASMLQVYDLRKVLITYYVKAVIFYAIQSPKLLQWVEPDGITANIDTNEDMASVFSIDLDEDFDRIAHKVTQRQFSRVYLSWIQHCASKRTDITSKLEAIEGDSRLVRLCYALSLVARRALATAAHNNCASVNVEFFLYGLHSLFKGDFRITGPDEWIFQDMEFLRKVISPAIRMALKLHQDHFAMPDEYADDSVLYDTIIEHLRGLVITHEADPDWRNAVLSNRPSLLALRHVFDEGSDLYKIIMLKKRHLSFRIIKVNRECVRGLWAGQQQELVFFRNRNPERGSIQNAKQALRNMINSSCDQPIGYPIYVSPLTTSYAGTNTQLSSVLFGEVSLSRVKRVLTSIWSFLRMNCGQTCRNFGSPDVLELQNISSQNVTAGSAATGGGDSYRELHPSHRGSDLRLSSRHTSRQPMPPAKASSSSLPLGSIAGFTRGASSSIKEKQEPTNTGAANIPVQETSFNESAFQLEAAVRITDLSCILPNLNRQRRSDPVWPSAESQIVGGKNGWDGWMPKLNTEGVVTHKWIPRHTESKLRSNTDKTIYLVKVNQYYVPVTEQGLTSCEPSAG